MQGEEGSGERPGERSGEGPERMDLVHPRPIAELLDCPPAARELLDGSAQFMDFDVFETVFQQGTSCRGLYVAISGQFVRKAERLETRLILGSVRPGQLVELGPLLCDGVHSYTLSNVEAGALLLLPKEALYEVFTQYPPLRMRLLEELAREVSRGYIASCRDWASRMRQRTRGLTSG
jgi:CRP-like cAMP-binding protein